MKRNLTLILSGAFLFGCSQVIPQDPTPSPGHLDADPPPAAAPEIPDIVTETPILPPPEEVPETEKYTVVVNEVPVKELLFALARDAKVNVDIHPSISGLVTLNAVEQTMPQILNRIAKQVNMRYELAGADVVILPDEPFYRNYKVDYVNMSRDAESTMAVATQIATVGSADVTTTGAGGGGGGGGQNNSTTEVKSTSNQRFWATLSANIHAILGEDVDLDEEVETSEKVVVNSETGIISVLANSRQHAQIQEFIDSVMENAIRQVLIEMTVVEVELSDGYQSGIDWAAFAGDFSIGQTFIGSTGEGLVPGTGTLNTTPFFGVDAFGNDVEAIVRLLQEFGTTSVLSSPRLMVMNNHTAMLKVVRNEVFFDIESDRTVGTQNTAESLTVETEVRTVPVGLVMAVTPQINENDRVTINVRPTITSIASTVRDPGPALIAASAGLGSGVQIPDNLIPEINVRELESMLHVNSGQIAILGGLMRDDVRRNSDQVPGLGEIPAVGEIFKRRDDLIVKTELVVFIRPRVIRNASLDGDLGEYRQFLRNVPGFAQ